VTEPHATPATDTHEATRASLLDAGGPGAHAHDDHGDGAPLGPVDAQAWGAGILGVAVGGLVAVLLYLVSYH
jgi:hypothetical protein